MAYLDPTALPERPSMPTSADQERAAHSAVRESILDDDWDETAIAWRKEHLDPKVEVTFGPPDTSRNSLSDAARQLSIPGLYGLTPRVSAPPGEPLGEVVIGLLERSGYWTKMQEVQYKTLGMGDYLVRLDLDPATLELSVRLVSPANVYVRCDPDTPDRPRQLWELRLRQEPAATATGPADWGWFWDVVDLDGGGSFRVVRQEGEDLVDWSRWYLGEEGEEWPAGGLTGEAYPYRGGDGRPLLPYVVYRAHDSGRPWNTYHMRGAHRGTLNEALYWTYTGRAALSASGRAVVVVGAEPPATDLWEGDRGDVVRSIAILPGSAIFLEPSEAGGQATVTEVGPGAELSTMTEFCLQYGLQQLTRWGLNPSDVSRVSANPASGAALYISNAGKRDFSDRIRPLFRRSDLSALRLVAVLARAAGLGPVPEEGYGISYVPIPVSPQERASRREDLDWRIARGHLSEIEAYREEHPGTSRTQAMAALVQAQADATELEAAVRSVLPAPTTTTDDEEQTHGD